MSQKADKTVCARCQGPGMTQIGTMLMDCSICGGVGFVRVTTLFDQGGVPDKAPLHDGDDRETPDRSTAWLFEHEGELPGQQQPRSKDD